MLISSGDDSFSSSLASSSCLDPGFEFQAADSSFVGKKPVLPSLKGDSVVRSAIMRPEVSFSIWSIDTMARDRLLSFDSPRICLTIVDTFLLSQDWFWYSEFWARYLGSMMRSSWLIFLLQGMGLRASWSRSGATAR